MEIETIGIGGTIRLGQFLKYANIAESGAHAKEILEEGLVAVDGQPDQHPARGGHHGEHAPGPVVARRRQAPVEFGGELVEVGDPVWVRVQVQLNSC